MLLLDPPRMWREWRADADFLLDLCFLSKLAYLPTQGSSSEQPKFAYRSGGVLFASLAVMDKVQLSTLYS
jgi:hypothetical protein